jgi:protein TonB
MAATSLPVARLLQLHVAIAWQEAVAVASAADTQSAAEAIPLTLDDCHISTAGTVHLATNPPSRRGQELTALQLLRAMLEGQPAPAELRDLVATADDALASFPSERGDQARPQRELRWFVSANPQVEIARLAARGLAADLGAVGAVTERSTTDAPTPPLVRTRPRVPIERVSTPRRPGVTVRVQRLSPATAVGIAAILLVLASAAGAMGVFVGGVTWAPLAPDVANAPPGLSSAAADSAARVRTNAPAGRPLGSEPVSAVIPLLEPAAPSPPDAAGAEPEAAGRPAVPPETRTYSSLDQDVEPPVLLNPQLPSVPREDSEQGRSEMELVIDEQGQVRQVRLQSPDISLNDRMLVAAAKAWQFRPATRDGHPVSYVLRVPVTR